MMATRQFVPNLSKWDGRKDGLKIFRYEKPSVNYNEMIGQTIQRR